MVVAFVVAVLVGVLTLSQFFGDVLDYAFTVLKAQDAALAIADRMRDPNWGANAYFSAMTFSKKYLDRIFGAPLFSVRVLAICVAVALVTTIALFNVLVLNNVRHVTGFVIILAAINGVIDAVSLVFARMTISRAVSRGKQASATSAVWAIILLCLIAYLAMGIAWSGWNVTAALLSKTHSIDVGTLLLEIFLWLPGLAYMHYLNIAPATAPGALTTLILLFTVAIPALFVKTRQFWKPLLITALKRFGSAPPWTGKLLALICGGVLLILHYVFRV